MGEESLKEEILQFFRGFGASIFSRVSHLTAALSDILHSKPVGTVAAFAIALICTWKYMKAAENRRKRLEKREETEEGSSTSSTSGASTSISLHQTQSSQRSVKNLVAEAPIELTMAQVVKRQLNGGRKMTCQLLGVILQESSPEELQKHAVVRPEVVDVLIELARACDLYLMTRLLDDESEANVLAALENAGLFSVGLNRNKVLFCSTEAGRSSFVRQLEPDWHVDTSLETISQLSRFIRHELHISPIGPNHSAPNVLNAATLEGYFGQLSQH
ncbi:hypothetical protein KP509_02G027400 [Ceratopteris richardii]|uniref:Peroxisome biogenesis protein 22 n=2 Tax=Ceratopteris richardii TaxID=49495 RepID=A0A8T2VC88_CERRI|nr:hypothetical protein KP509_02G027400 [Ceratopteris richardii]